MRLIFCIAASLVVATATAVGATGPRVALVESSPVVVVGSGFDHASAVHVTVAVGSRHLAKVVESTSKGSFAARWRTSLELGVCATTVVTAASAHRSVTVKTVPAQESCGAQRVSP